MCNVFGDFKIGEIIYQDSKKENLEILKCVQCQSLYYAGVDPVCGYEDSEFTDNFWIHYTQIGAGIVDMLKPLFYLGQNFQGHILDVGCGFGYVVDFINKLGYGNAVGLEMAEYGSIGAKLLKAPIYRSYYKDCEKVQERRYNIVYCCEVLEHVPDPRSFIREISGALDENGILVLTTPSAKAVGIDENSFDALAALCPYHHFFLSSRDALIAILNECDFKHIKVIDTGNRLFAWASKSNLPKIEENIPWGDCYKYLEILSENEDPNVSCGALQRLLKVAVANGEYSLAEQVLGKLKECGNKEYQLDLDYPDIKRYINISASPKEFVKNPVWYGSALLNAAIYAGIVEYDLEKKARLLDASCEILSKDASRFEYTQFINDAIHDHRSAINELRTVYAEILNKWFNESNRLLGLDYRAISILKSLAIKILFLHFSGETYAIFKKRLSSDLTWWKKNWKERVNNSLKISV